MLSSIFGFFSGVGSDAKASAYNAGDPGLIPGSGRFPGEGNGNPLQHSCLGNPMQAGTWWATIHGVAKSQTRLSDFTFFPNLGLVRCFMSNSNCCFLTCIQISQEAGKVV